MGVIGRGWGLGKEVGLAVGWSLGGSIDRGWKGPGPDWWGKGLGGGRLG